VALRGGGLDGGRARFGSRIQALGADARHDLASLTHVGGDGHPVRVDDSCFDITNPLDPLNPIHSLFWGDWDCPKCAADGSRDELVRGQCPHCGSEVDLLA
jgi:hypothetical protein